MSLTEFSIFYLFHFRCSKRSTIVLCSKEVFGLFHSLLWSNCCRRFYPSWVTWTTGLFGLWGTSYRFFKKKLFSELQDLHDTRELLPARIELFYSSALPPMRTVPTVHLWILWLRPIGNYFIINTFKVSNLLNLTFLWCHNFLLLYSQWPGSLTYLVHCHNHPVQ